jgi:hypothetical protein
MRNGSMKYPYPIPENIIEKMKANEKRMEFVFESIWGLLPKTPERDEIMLHVLQAKTKLNQFIKENDTNGN